MSKRAASFHFFVSLFLDGLGSIDFESLVEFCYKSIWV